MAQEAAEKAAPKKAAQQKKGARPKAGDATGRKKAELESQQAEEIAERQKTLSMATQQVQLDAEHGVFDPRTGEKVAEKDASEAKTEVDGEEVRDFGVETVEESEDDMVTIRVNETLFNVTIGAGTLFNFEEGKQYVVPRNVAFHLEEKGYVWH